jgi:hypothetical protein
VADSDAIRARRSRLHRQGDHSRCLPSRCPVLGGRRLSAVPDGAEVVLPDEVVELLEALDGELDAGDRTVRALAFRLARLSASSGPAAVQALRALGELVAAQRGRDVPQVRDVPPDGSSGTRHRRRRGSS